MPERDLHHLVSGLADAELYERGRADWPAAVCDALRSGLGLAQGAAIADVGAGSGKLSRVLAAGGFDVTGIEPLPAMREVLARSLGPDRALDATAEALPLADASVDAVTCGDAFHWFDHDAAAAEFHRVLRPGGGVAVAWRVPDPGRTGGWAVEIERLVAEVRPEHPGYTPDRGMDALARHGGFTPRTLVQIPFEHCTDRAGILDFVGSITFVGVLPDAERAALLARCGAALDAADGEVLVWPVVAEVWLSRRRP